MGGQKRRTIRPGFEALESRELLAAAAPQVTNVVRLGQGRQRTRIVLTFSQPMDRSSVQNPGSYLLAQRNRQGHFDFSTDPITVPIAAYDPATQSATIVPRGRLKLHRDYLLVVNASFAGLASEQGIVLDGNSEGVSGGNFVTILRGFGPKRPR